MDRADRVVRSTAHVETVGRHLVRKLLHVAGQLPTKKTKNEERVKASNQQLLSSGAHMCSYFGSV